MEYRLTAKVVLNPKLGAIAHTNSAVSAEALQIILEGRLSTLRNLMFKVTEVKVEAIEE